MKRYVIAVVCKTFREYREFIKQFPERRTSGNGRNIVNEFEYIHVHCVDSTRGYRFDGISVVGSWENTHHRNPKFYEIFDKIDYCFL